MNYFNFWEEGGMWGGQFFLNKSLCQDFSFHLYGLQRFFFIPLHEAISSRASSIHSSLCRLSICLTYKTMKIHEQNRWLFSHVFFALSGIYEVGIFLMKMMWKPQQGLALFTSLYALQTYSAKKNFLFLCMHCRPRRVR